MDYLNGYKCSWADLSEYSYITCIKYVYRFSTAHKAKP